MTGQTIIEEALEKGQDDIGKKLNAQNIGESFLIYENTDYAYIITREYKPVEKRYYLGFKEIKARDKKLKANEADIRYFVHPYEQNNPARLCEDKHLKESLSRLKVNDGDGDESIDGVSKTNVGRRSRIAGGSRRVSKAEKVAPDDELL